MIEGRIVPAGRVSGTQAAAALFAPWLAGRTGETLCVAHLDAELALLHLSTTVGAFAAQVEVSLRQIVREALSAEARAIILAHNHPGGSPVPSRADRRTTCRLVEIGRPLEIMVMDHLIFAGEEVVSFRELGLL